MAVRLTRLFANCWNTEKKRPSPMKAGSLIHFGGGIQSAHTGRGPAFCRCCSFGARDFGHTGFWFVGVTGLVVIVVGLGIVMAAPGISGTIAFVTALFLVVVGIFAILFFIRRRKPSDLILEERLSGSAAQDFNQLLGTTGVALTPLGRLAPPVGRKALGSGYRRRVRSFGHRCYCDSSGRAAHIGEKSLETRKEGQAWNCWFCFFLCYS